jgi:hypothetical protein
MMSHHHNEDVVPYLLIYVICCVRFFRELADEDVLLAYSMSMSMSMADPVVAATAAPSTAVPTSAPTIANVTVEASDGPSFAPNATISESSPPELAVVESPVSSALSVSGSPTSTAVVAMASAGGVILALLAIRRSRRTKGDYYEDLDTHQLKDGSTRSTIDEDAQCSGAEILAASVGGGARRPMTV